MKGNILIIEDEKKLCEIMSLYLTNEGYVVHCANDGQTGEVMFTSDTFDLVILDIMMPYKDGWSLLRKFKSISPTLPVIMTTARGEEDDRIFGLELGADDYMVKPLSMRELVLRVNLRISSNNNHYMIQDDFITLNSLSINDNTREAIENSIKLTLTPKEFDLMLFFTQNLNLVFRREHLLDKVWGYDFIGDTRTVDSHIKNLREKSTYFNTNLKTVWGIGYKLEKET